MRLILALLLSTTCAWCADPVGVLSFSTTTPSIGESASSATITVTRTGGTSGAVSVTYATSDGYTATLRRPTGHDGHGRLRLAASNAHVHVESLIAYSLVY